MKVLTQDLIGAPLDWAMATILGFAFPELTHSMYAWFKAHGPRYSTSGDTVLEIMEREKIDIAYYGWDNPPYYGARNWTENTTHGTVRATGPTLRIAVCRAFVASKLGDEVEVPEELMK